jgi:hypothetical protein
MARGFESKDVEFQQSEAARVSTTRRTLTPDEREAFARRQALELTLTRVRSELAAAHAESHRQMLERAIAALEEQAQAER